MSNPVNVYVNSNNDLLKIVIDDNPENPLLDTAIQYMTDTYQYESIQPNNYKTLGGLLDFLTGEHQFLINRIRQCKSNALSETEFWQTIQDTLFDKGYIAAPIYCHNHGQTTFSINGVEDWDTACVGLAYIARSDVSKHFNLTNKDNSQIKQIVYTQMVNDLNGYNQYLNETSYGFVITDTQGYICDSTYGFYGYDADTFLTDDQSGILKAVSDNCDTMDWKRTHNISRYAQYDEPD